MLLLLLLLSKGLILWADSCEVHRIFGKGDILISKRKAYEGMVFDDSEQIECSGAKVGMTVIYKSKRHQNEYVDFYAVVANGKPMALKAYRGNFRKYEAEHMSSSVPLRTKGLETDWQNLYVLLDKLTLYGWGHFLPETQFCAVWKDGDTEVVASLTASDDKTEIYLTQAIFCGRPPRPVEVRIMATDHWDNETPHLVRTIWIEPLPL